MASAYVVKTAQHFGKGSNLNNAIRACRRAGGRGKTYVYRIGGADEAKVFIDGGGCISYPAGAELHRIAVFNSLPTLPSKADENREELYQAEPSTA